MLLLANITWSCKTCMVINGIHLCLHNQLLDTTYYIVYSIWKKNDTREMEETLHGHHHKSIAKLIAKIYKFVEHTNQ
jgi:hypothetical protein